MGFWIRGQGWPAPCGHRPELPSAPLAAAAAAALAAAGALAAEGALAAAGPCGRRRRGRLRWPRRRGLCGGASSARRGSGERQCEQGLPRLWLLDRDGVINIDVGRPGVVNPEQFALLPGAAGAIRRLNEAGCRVTVVTNQTAVAKGLLSSEALEQIHSLMAARLADSGAHVDEVLVAVQGHRLKPGPAMVLEALEVGRCLPSEAVLVGDKLSDLEAAAAAGVRAALVTCSRHGEAAAQRLLAGDGSGGAADAAVHEDLAAVVEAVMGPQPAP